ncbi:hypothetical protein MBGDN05_00445 [Thermoplasmatales archaeon SCGC AB-539-N05]|nr:hypothetical protein MBGDN05_00445 [Thermoplasmatales archaeon SCGC AB-539-N05]
MVKVKELIDFVEIKDVIDIDSDIDSTEGKKNIVKDYIISDNLKEHILDVAENISKPKHKSVQIIGGYGSGKSHLLAWFVSILENKELIDNITNDGVKKRFKEVLDREFAVVQFELQPGVSALSDFFFDRIEQQLNDKHDIEVPKRDSSKVEDFKKDIKDIIDAVKRKDPKMGLVVVIDEISDFLKQKTMQQIHRDMQFLRILGQVSQSLDFLFIGAMQENVFSNPKYVGEAVSFGRVAERFHIVTISREDIKKVISERVLKKDSGQREQIDKLLSDFKRMFSPINSEPDKYINLYPIHPSVIDVFSDLPYFEKRGVIQFATVWVSKILDCEFPKFVTYDSVFDEINSKHHVRNLDEVRPVIDIIETLDSKIELVDKDKRDDARRLIKALAVLKLHGKSADNGATPEELANILLITSKTIKNTDRIIVILDKLREVTSGQFIAKTENNYYYLNPEQSIDYDEVVKRKMKTLPEGMENEELLKILKYTDLIEADLAESYVRSFKDSCPWSDKKSFRLGNFIFDDGSDQVKSDDLDFNLVVQSPYVSSSKLDSSKETAILSIKYSDELDDALKYLAATKLLINENYAKSVMIKKQNTCSDDARNLILQKMIDSEIEIDGSKKKVKSIISKEPDNIDEFFHHVKENVFNDYFSSTYSKYPKFLNQISYENVKGEVESTINELLSKSERNLFSNAKNILSSLDLMDIDGNIDTSNSLYVKVIVEELEKNKGKNVKIDDILEKLQKPPFGLDVEVIYLVFVVLTYNGEINLRKRGGGTITSSDLKDVFNIGISAFRDIPYATLETEFPIDSVIKLFRALKLNQGYVRNIKDRTKAVQEFRLKTLELKESLDIIFRIFQEISSKPDPIIDKQELSKKIDELDTFPIGDFLEVKTVNDFRKVEYDDKQIDSISKNLELIQNIKGFIDDYNGFINREYLYMKNSMEWMNSNPVIFNDSDKKALNEIRVECRPLVEETNNVLNSEQRRILKGKLQQYKKKYVDLYFMKHKTTIGDSIHWERLENVSKSNELKRLRDMKAIRCIAPLNLIKLEEKLLSLSKARCTNLTEDHLKENYLCTWCRFPETLKNIKDINEEISSMQESLGIISKQWNETILSEVENYSDNVKLLSTPEKKIIQDIQSKKSLPDDIEQDAITALNNLFSELSEIEISPKEVIDFIFSESSVLDFETFSNKLDEYKDKILETGDKKNIRIKRMESQS